MLLIDDREKLFPLPKLVALLAERDVPSEVQRLEVGDYAFSVGDETHLITRKAADLWPSVYSNHFREELEAMATVPNARRWFLMEGVWAGVPGQGLGLYQRTGPQWFRMKRTFGASEDALAGVQVSVGADNINLLWSSGKSMTVALLASLYKKANEGFKSTPRKAHRLKADTTVSSLMGLWPKLSEKQAKALLKQFSMQEILTKILQGEEKQFLTTPSVGPKAVQNLQELLTHDGYTTLVP